MRVVSWGGSCGEGWEEGVMGRGCGKKKMEEGNRVSWRRSCEEDGEEFHGVKEMNP